MIAGQSSGVVSRELGKRKRGGSHASVVGAWGEQTTDDVEELRQENVRQRQKIEEQDRQMRTMEARLQELQRLTTHSQGKGKGKEVLGEGF